MKRDVAKAHEARHLQTMIGCPSPCDFTGVVRLKLLLNCPVNPSNVANAHNIFGPDLASLRGKTVRRKPLHVYEHYVAIGA
jgi:hypothetical protein